MCNCISELTKKLRGHYDGKFKKPIDQLTIQSCINFESGSLDTYSEVKISLAGQKKREDVMLVHSYCPFCGVKIRGDKEA